MVTDSLQNLEQYRGLHKNMDTVIDFLKKCDLTALPDGKTVIDGERVFVNVMEEALAKFLLKNIILTLIGQKRIILILSETERKNWLKEPLTKLSMRKLLTSGMRNLSRCTIRLN